MSFYNFHTDAAKFIVLTHTNTFIAVKKIAPVIYFILGISYPVKCESPPPVKD